MRVNCVLESPFRPSGIRFQGSHSRALVASLTLGGDNGGDVTKLPFPVYMYVDYVRVYQKAE